jgi:hypothetical protein
VLRTLATSHALANRDRKWQLYVDAFPPRRGEKILDVGVSLYDHYPGENYFLHRYPYHDQLTGVGIVDLSGLREGYPRVHFVEADGRDLPFEDDAFDVVHSNAVVEHVGPAAEQARFVSELVRVARSGFLTTPNRWFPFDVHTRVPLVPWLPQPAAVWTLAHLGRFGTRNWGTWPLSPRSFRRMFPSTVSLEIVNQRIAGWPATITVLFRKP